MPAEVPSVSAVNRAGDALRRIHGVPNPYTVMARPMMDDSEIDEIFEAVDCLVAWRAAHAKPLDAATMGLRSRVATMGCEQVEVSQRLKRIPTIVDKLRREPKMMLGRMADIGGCRAVLRDLEEVQRIKARYSGDKVTIRMKDYIEQPNRMGTAPCM